MRGMPKGKLNAMTFANVFIHWIFIAVKMLVYASKETLMCLPLMQNCRKMKKFKESFDMKTHFRSVKKDPKSLSTYLLQG